MAKWYVQSGKLNEKKLWVPGTFKDIVQSGNVPGALMMAFRRRKGIAIVPDNQDNLIAVNEFGDGIDHRGMIVIQDIFVKDRIIVRDDQTLIFKTDQIIRFLETKGISIKSDDGEDHCPDFEGIDW